MPLRHRGYGAYISYNGDELEAHKVKVESDRVVSCYIASEAGKEFKVHWVDSKPPSHLSVEIRMDGRRMGVLSHIKQSSKTSNGGFRVAIDAHRPYHFTPLAITDDDSLPSAYSEDLGTIEVRLRRVRDFISVPFTPKATARPNATNVHKRNRKGNGLSHCVSLGKKKDVKAHSTILRPLLIDDKPYVVFRFSYRPREFLELNGIIRGRTTTRTASTASSSISSAGRGRKRKSSGSSGTPSSDESMSNARKRPRTLCAYDTPNSGTIPVEDETVNGLSAVDDDGFIAQADEQDNKETVIEVHLSSKNKYTIPKSGNSAGQGLQRVKREPSVQRDFASLGVHTEPYVTRKDSPLGVSREPSIKRAFIPTDVPQEPCIVKREASPAEALVRRTADRESTPVSEVRLTYRNNYAFPDPENTCVDIKKELDAMEENVDVEYSVLKAISGSDDMNPAITCTEETLLSDSDREDEKVVEIHLSASGQCFVPASDSSTIVTSEPTHPGEREHPSHGILI